MFKKEFASSYTSFDSTGATYIIQHTKVKLVGIDYLSIGCLEDIVETHRVLLGQVGLMHMHHSPSAAAKYVAVPIPHGRTLHASALCCQLRQVVLCWDNRHHLQGLGHLSEPTRLLCSLTTR